MKKPDWRQKTGTYAVMHAQIVFAVKYRQKLISPTWEESLYKLITGIIQGKGQKLLAINGMPDHIHIFIGFRPNIRISDLVREIKKSSVAFIKENGLVASEFRWQGGYYVQTYHKDIISRVIRYIENQKEHHKTKSFKKEYIDSLNEVGVEYDERFVVDPVPEDHVEAYSEQREE